jgi:transcriptional regulator with XRE-family HTH domain
VQQQSPHTVLRLRLERQKRQLSQQTVAVLARIDQPELSEFETGKLRPSKPKLQRLADLFGVAPEDLLRPMKVVEQ